MKVSQGPGRGTPRVPARHYPNEALPDKTSVVTSGVHVHHTNRSGRVEIYPGLGFVRGSRVATHVPPGDDAEAMACGLCSALTWVESHTPLYLAVNPQVPLLCCGCAEISIPILQRFLRDRKLMAVDVPDLSRLNVN